MNPKRASEGGKLSEAGAGKTVSPPPRATYRMQFHRGFTLRDALPCVPYLESLGISHLYASPLLSARAGSTHGYDQTDPTRINAEIGSEEDLEALVQDLRSRGMGLVLDIVPNHMATDTRKNAWWRDVLQYGRGSRFAGYFDIDWNASHPGLSGKVLLPILGDTLERVLDRGELRLDRNGSGQVLRYFDHELPVAPDAGTGDSLPADRAGLEALLRRQHYVLCHWRDGDRHLNYRRFFSITDLAGVRVEVPEVFEAMHGLVLEWVRRGWLDGLRVDHPDGLHDPAQYLHRLRCHAPAAWITVEKILEPGEELPMDWPVAGTTGYDFAHEVGGLFIDPAGEAALTVFYSEFTGEPTDYPALVREKKRFVLDHLFEAEVTRILTRIVESAARDERGRHLAPSVLRDALVEIAACFPVYRTYLQAETRGANEVDARWIDEGCAMATRARPDLSAAITFLRERLRAQESDECVQRFQQLTGPAMAKGVEDTAFYCFNRMIALNEVGGDPGRFGMTLKEFHDAMRRRQVQWPGSMLASSTHDTKRSEDVRARLALLAQIPDAWISAVRRWSRINEKHRGGNLPDRNAEYLLYQTLVGAWPLSVPRAVAYMEKASREAKQHTGWTDPNAGYERALRAFVESILVDPEFLADFETFVTDLVLPGQIQSLAQVLIKLTAPGVPDFYQGTELWDGSLVDPDNRRPVDFEERQRLLAELSTLTADAIWARRSEGLPKMWVIQQALACRRQWPEALAGTAEYQPLEVIGPYSDEVIGFMRGHRVISLAPRFAFRTGADWGDTQVILPEGQWHNALSGENMQGGLRVWSEVLRRFPVALLVLRPAAEWRPTGQDHPGSSTSG